MRLSVVPLILSAGLAISQVAAAPIRVVIVSEPVNGSHGLSSVRVGHAAAPNSHVATMHMGGMQMNPVGRKGCAGSLRNKADQISAWFKATFGLPNNHPEMQASSEPTPGLIRILPVEPVVPTPNLGGEEPARIFVPSRHRPHRFHDFHHFRQRGSFAHRLTRALMMLGPWEGRMLAFVIGCGIGVLIRMFWVLAVVGFRSVRGSRREEELLASEVIFDEQEHLLPPPQYNESEAEDVKEKN
ncbi:hypothetical protein M422DRAFT_246495 [Sphaerobolus stellatus SS14]|nr:hypothetical protein M422DRAFT_246495 [Sphaerobolus stellatus SS14]